MYLEYVNCFKAKERHTYFVLASRFPGKVQVRYGCRMCIQGGGCIAQESVQVRWLFCYDEQLFTKINQSGHTTQIRTCPRATQQGRIKCRHHITIPAVLTQAAILEEGG